MQALDLQCLLLDLFAECGGCSVHSLELLRQGTEAVVRLGSLEEAEIAVNLLNNKMFGTKLINVAVFTNSVISIARYGE